MSEHAFKTIRDEAGEIVKFKGPISNYKSVTVNSFNDKSYIHLSDVSKCFTKGGGFDLKKAKSVTLNRDEVNTFIEMSEKLPIMMDKVLKIQQSTDESDEGNTTSKRQKRQTDSDDETTKASRKITSKQLKRKKQTGAHPYRRPSSTPKHTQKVISDSSDTTDESDEGNTTSKRQKRQTDGDAETTKASRKITSKQLKRKKQTGAHSYRRPSSTQKKHTKSHLRQQ